MELQLVGRDVEMAHIRALIEDGGCLVLAGPAGIGKTRLALEAVRLATARGMDAETVTGSATAQSLAFAATTHVIPNLPARNPHELLAAAERSLHARAAATGLLFIADDAHLLDPGSATLVQQLASRGVVTLLATVRTAADPIPDSIVSLWTDPGGRRLELGPLRRPVVQALAESLLGGEVGADLESEVWRLSQGYPMFIQEVLLAARSAGTIVRGDDGVWRLAEPLGVSARLVDLIRSRLETLPRSVRHTLEALAVAEPMTRQVVEQVVGAQRLDDLERRGLVVQGRPSAGAPVRLAHPLYGEVLRVVLTPTRAAALAARWADALARSTAAGPGDLVRAATLLVEAGRDPDPDLALRAARAAVARFEGPLAERLARIALAAPGAGPEGAGVVLGLALQLQGRVEEAEQVLATASVTATSDEQRAEAALASARNLHWAMGDRTGAVEVIRHALEHIGEPASRGALEAELALYYAVVGDMGNAGATATRALQGAAMNPHTELNALIVQTLAFCVHGQLGALEAALPRALTLAASHTAEDPLAEDQLLLNLAHTLILHDVEAVHPLATERGSRPSPLAGMWHATVGLCQLATGAVVEAWVSLREAVHMLETADPFGNLTMVRSMQALAAAQSGNATVGAEALAATDAQLTLTEPRTRVWHRRAQAWLCALEGDLDRAAEIAAQAGRDAVDHSYLTWGAEALYDAVRFDRPERVADELTLVASRTDVRILTLFAEHAGGFAAQDAKRVEQAATGLLEHGFLVSATDAFADVAELEGPGPAGAARLRSAVLHARCATAWSPAGVPDRLTAREAQIVERAALGIGNREIAAELFLSPRTVENHLSRVYHRFGLEGRSALRQVLDARFVARVR